MTISINGNQINFNSDGINKSAVAYKRFDKWSDDQSPLFKGRCGGSHGTSHGCNDYECNGMIIRQVFPGALEQGWLEILPVSPSAYKAALNV